MEQTNSLLELPSKEEWYPYIKPTRHKHESGFYCFEVGYCRVGSDAEVRDKIVLGGIAPDHIGLWEMMDQRRVNVNIDCLKGGFIRFHCATTGLHWLGCEDGAGFSVSSMMLKTGWPQIKNSNSLT